MSGMQIGLVATVAVALGVLLFARARERTDLALVAKAVASAAFVALAVVRWRSGSAVDTWLVAALALGLAGDLLLQGRRTFDLGLAAFLLGHVAYVVAFSLARPLVTWPAWPLFVLAAPAALIGRWLWSRLGRRRVPVAVYIAAISAMVWGAVAAGSSGSVPPATVLGAVLFYVSDVFVARERFVRPSFTNRLVGLPLYYAGQVLLALTVGVVRP